MRILKTAELEMKAIFIGWKLTMKVYLLNLKSLFTKCETFQLSKQKVLEPSNLPFFREMPKNNTFSMSTKFTKNRRDRKMYQTNSPLLLVWVRLLRKSNSNLAIDFVCRFCPLKPVFLQDSQIFRIHILLNFEVLFLEHYCFQNSEGL